MIRQGRRQKVEGRRDLNRSSLFLHPSSFFLWRGVVYAPCIQNL
jgi:hypothetical protein